MPIAVQWFADYQPFTPMMETVRGLPLDTSISNNASLAAWCVTITVVGYVWAKKLYKPRPLALTLGRCDGRPYRA
ncbi:MAG TPA: hypothetical protein VFI46_10705 [Jiangellaceae bacterium]|nr:hypothetical protein [Jiangellaceae bacterium]